MSRKTCCGCGTLSPEVAVGENTLTLRHGWRVRRRTDLAGLEWRCPVCWKKYKAALDAETARESEDEIRPVTLSSGPSSSKR